MGDELTTKLWAELSKLVSCGNRKEAQAKQVFTEIVLRDPRITKEVLVKFLMEEVALRLKMLQIPANSMAAWPDD